MDHSEQLRRSGLFDTQVPRYTSYPPANHFGRATGRRHQGDWLAAIPDGSAVSLYLHIPFCKRLCWFCACRTQGTKSLRPVDAYIENLMTEVSILRTRLHPNIAISRLHLGGGTPTILGPATMDRLLDHILNSFPRAPGFELSVEIDPTEASDALLQTLADHGMNRASIGVQDFDPQVQAAIGRPQSFEQTSRVVTVLRDAGVRSLNMDLLYGLPFQTAGSMTETALKVLALEPDRLALYGYAHVPWMSKRQVMIDAATLPDAETRFSFAQLAKRLFEADGFQPIGIDHFARPTDGLAIAAGSGNLRRNFQGYTDDGAAALLGLGASAISRFPQGYVQNAAATSAYVKHILGGELAGMRGYALTDHDRITAAMIEGLMCNFEIDGAALIRGNPKARPQIETALDVLKRNFSDHVCMDAGVLRVRPESTPLIRIFANALDTFRSATKSHSSAI
ncbi:oxygen-independent coproporphyrinogen III oxidase [Yoonia sp. SS1-5]|uniref:Coproporphyrinogen-III oxidase n=1 Tax=Yoonia rhodophyticola TaxID=3137370 RepID=A0AAN0MBI3_9RHOB